MNDKIKELAEQSYEAATITTIDPFTQEVVVDYIDGTKLIFNKEKFAELLEKEFEAKYFSAGYIQGRSDGTIETVQECINICNQAILQNQDTLSNLITYDLAEKMIIHGAINQAQKLGKGIKQHFGFEE